MMTINRICQFTENYFFCFCQLNILPSKLLYPTKTCYIVVKPNQTAICTTINIQSQGSLVHLEGEQKLKTKLISDGRYNFE